MRSTYEDVVMDDGVTLRTARFEPDAGPGDVIQFVHGFGEHIGMYEPLAQFFTDHGYAFVIHDQRGHGSMPDKTPAQRAKALGVVPSYFRFLEDITTVRGRIDDWYGAPRVILAGLSMGGNIVANYLERIPEPRYERAIVESPWLRLAKPMPGALTVVARAVGAITPSVAVASGLNLDAVTRDPVETAKLKADPYYHGRISMRLYAQILDAGEYAIAHAADIKLPTLLMAGTDDQIVSAAAIRQLAAGARDNVKLREYEGGFHCLHYDTCSPQVQADMLAFCDAHA